MSGTQTRHKLLVASAEEIVAHGYAGASLTSIGAHLGLTKGALAHHFPTKNDLAVALLNCLRQAMTQEIDAARRAHPDGGLQALIATILGLGGRVAREPEVAAGLELVTDRSSPITDVADLLATWQHSFAELIAMAQDADQLDGDISCEAAAEHLLIVSVGIAALADRSYRSQDRQRLSPMRTALELLGARDVNRLVDDVLGTMRVDELPPPTGIARGSARP